MNATFVEVVISILLIVLPWAFGGVLPWSTFLVEGVAACLVLGWVASLLRRDKITFVATAILQLSFFSFAYFALTLMRLPAFLVGVLSPRSAAATNALQTLAGISHPSYRLSMDPTRTLSELLLFGSYFIIFFAILNNYRSKARIRRFFYLLAGNGVLLSMFALVQRSLWNGKIYWTFATESGTSFGTYVNHNHFAGFVEMAIGALFAITLSHFANSNNVKIQGWRRRFAWLTARGLPVLFLALFLLVVMLTAVVYSLSRGALLSLAIALILTKIMLRSTRQSTFRVPVFPFVAVLLLAAALALVGASTLVHRFSNLASYTNLYRLDMWQNAAHMVKDFPLFGVGLGAFNEVFPAYKQSHFEIETVYLESDWLQACVELGLVGMVLVGLMVWVFLKNVIQRYSQRRDRQVRSFLFGGTIGLMALMTHSFLDFNMHIPANALTFFSLGAVVLIAASTREEGERGMTPTVTGTLTPRSRGFLLATIGSMAVLLLVLSYYEFQTQRVMLEWQRAPAHSVTGRDFSALFNKPRTFFPLASEWHYDKAEALETMAAEPQSNLLDAADWRRQGVDAIQGALNLAPGCGKYWGLRGRILSGLGQRASAERSFEHALELNRSSYELDYYYGISLLEDGKITAGLVQIGRARAMANVFPLEPTFNYLLRFTRDPNQLALIVLNDPEDRAMFKVLLGRNGL